MSYRLVETMLLQPGRIIRNQERHLARLERSCRENGFACDSVPARLADFVQSQPENLQQKLRLIYSKSGEMELTAEPYTAPSGDLYVQLVPEAIMGFSPAQFAHKFVDSPLREFYVKALDSLYPAAPHSLYPAAPHSLRPPAPHSLRPPAPHSLYPAAPHSLRPPACPEGPFDSLFINPQGIITEGTRCNFYIEIDGQLITSPVSAGLLPGTYRDLLIEQGCLVEPITHAMLEQADACFISNALLGKRPVVSQKSSHSL